MAHSVHSEKASELNYHVVLNAMPVPSVILNGEGQIGFVNTAFERMIGYSLGDVRQIETLRRMVCPNRVCETQGPEACTALFKPQPLGTQSEHPFKVKVQTKSGLELTMMASVTFIGEPDHALQLITLIDVTESERARWLNRLHTQVWNQSSDLMYLSSPDGRMLDANPAGATALKLPLDDIRKVDSFLRFTPELDQAQLEKLRLEADCRGIAATTLTVRRDDGTSFRALVTMASLRDDFGAVTARLVVGRDLSTEEAKQALVEQYSVLVSSARDPIITVDTSGRITLCNPATVETFGYDEEEILGAPLDLLIPASFHGHHSKWVKEFFASEEVSRSMAYLRTVAGAHKDGKPLRLQVSLSKSRGPAGVMATAVIRDVTTLQDLQDQLHQADKLSAIGQLTGGVAHDVNNLLAVVMGNAELIGDMAEPTSRLQKLSERIVDAARRGGQLTNRLLAFSRKAPIEPENLDLAKALPDFVETLRRTLGGRIDLRLDIENGEFVSHLDRSMFESCLINLSVNARDAMPDGGKLTMSLTKQRREALDGPKDWVVLTVADTGIGMTEDIRQHVFEPFFTTKEPASGSGLGLSMVHGFVHQCGGAIDVQSSPGNGAIFILRFPEASEQESQSVKAEEESPSTPHNHTVLVVEDNEMLRMTLVDQLEEAGCRALEAANVEQAKTIMAAHSEITFVISDFDLGVGPTGNDLAKWVHAEGPKTPGVILSGYLDTPHNMITETGWKRAQKPIQIAEVIAMLN